MSASGQTRSDSLIRVTSAFPLEADIPPCPNDVGMGPIADVASAVRNVLRELLGDPIGDG